jgi:hypothetical protein
VATIGGETEILARAQSRMSSASLSTNVLFLDEYEMKTLAISPQIGPGSVSLRSNFL